MSCLAFHLDRSARSLRPPNTAYWRGRGGWPQRRKPALCAKLQRQQPSQIPTDNLPTVVYIHSRQAKPKYKPWKLSQSAPPRIRQGLYPTHTTRAHARCVREGAQATTSVHDFVVDLSYIEKINPIVSHLVAIKKAELRSAKSMFVMRRRRL